MAEQDQTGPTCPVNLRWLRAMKQMLPEEIWNESKLSKYGKCLAEEKK